MNKLETLTENVLGAVFEVSNTLGVGFLEKVYERALVRELGLRGIRGAAQAPLTVAYIIRDRRWGNILRMCWWRTC